MKRILLSLAFAATLTAGGLATPGTAKAQGGASGGYSVGGYNRPTYHYHYGSYYGGYLVPYRSYHRGYDYGYPTNFNRGYGHGYAGTYHSSGVRVKAREEGVGSLKRGY